MRKHLLRRLKFCFRFSDRKANIISIGVSPSGKATDSDSVTREFKSLYPSHEELRLNARFLYFCHKGVAGIVFETRKPLKSTVYLTQPRDSKGLFIK